MVHTSVNFQNGEKVNYQGREATIVSAHSYSNTITIEVDGKTITVDRNDLFGMNSPQKYGYYYDGYAQGIADCNEQIENNKNVINECKQLWSAAKKAIHTYRDQMRSILKDCGVSNVSQITDGQQRAQYVALANNKSAARMTQIHATADIIEAAHSTASAASYKQNLLQGQYAAGLLA